MESELARLLASVAGGPGPSARAAALVSRIVEQPFAVAGKRLRPLLVLLSARAAGGNPRDRGALMALAAAVEVLHAASLVHDDVIDQAATRRDRESLNSSFGNSVAVLAGDLLYTAFFSRILALAGVAVEKRIEVLEVFLRTTNAMCMGEILAQQAGGRPLGCEEYTEIAVSKTASLFSACCRAGAYVGGADGDSVLAMEEFGLRFGLLFQVADDLADGDVRVDAGVDLPALAESNAGAARRCLESLPPGRYRDALFDLVEYVADGARSRS